MIFISVNTILIEWLKWFTLLHKIVSPKKNKTTYIKLLSIDNTYIIVDALL